MINLCNYLGRFIFLNFCKLMFDVMMVMMMENDVRVIIVVRYIFVESWINKKFIMYFKFFNVNIYKFGLCINILWYLYLLFRDFFYVNGCGIDKWRKR